MNTFNKMINHFKTISKHKYYVMKFCFKCHRYRRGLLHDLTKFGPTEFFSSVKYYQGNRSPIDAEKEINGYSLAWQHHKGHNPHHWEYWIDNIGPREVKVRSVYETFEGEKLPIVCTELRSKPDALKIPYEYVVEMICDWLGAGIVYNKAKVDYNIPYEEPINYYNKCKPNRLIHPETMKLLEYYLNIIKEEGINSFCEDVINNVTIKEKYNNSTLW